MKLVQTNAIQAAVNQWKKTQGSIEHNLLDTNGQWIDHKLLVKIAKELDQPLTELVRNSGVYIPPPPPPAPKSKEFTAMMAQLRADEQEKEYKKLAGIHDETGPMFSGNDVKQVKEELTTIINFAVSVVAVGFALWYWARWWDPASRTLLSILGALLVLVAEVTVYAGYRHKVDSARQLERSKTDRGVVKEIYTITPGEEVKHQLVNETTEMEKNNKTMSKKSRKNKGKPQAKFASDQASASGSQQPIPMRRKVRA